MNTGDHIEEIFAQAKEKKSPAERETFLAEACRGEPELRREVESLLRAHDEAGDFLRQTVKVTEADFVSEKTGTMIGRYKLLEQIGEGGFGTVWMAEQEEPVRRRVALKIIKAGMDTREVIARFEAERQALALMEHPNVARVFDGGATETGRPYFVMELVRGVRITDYCEENKLSIPERLELFLQVCAAVQHAHQKGIIHRDLKPSNVLVSVLDDRPVPKVIDFGIAKATAQRLTDKTVFTRFQQVIGTPAYMSPEQAGSNREDIDTRSDIYSLGVLLYELLTGQTPFEMRKLMEVGLEAVLKTIREEEPPKPSTRLTTLTKEELAGAATRRRIAPDKLGKLVRGELDWIVMKALEKERARRYESASAFAEDLRRHLRQEPVVAAPPEFLYRAGKFVRRNRTRLAFASLLLVTAALAVAGGKFALNYQSARRAFQATGTNAVFTAAKSGDVQALRRLLDANPRLIGQRSTDGSTPLAYAAHAGNTNTLRLLLTRGAVVDATSRNGWTPLLEAAANCRVSAVATLLEAGADPNHASNRGETALMLMASWPGTVEVGRLLLAKGARLDAAVLPSRTTALQQAAMLGRADFVELLLAHGARTDFKDAGGNAPLHAAASGLSTADAFLAWNLRLHQLTAHTPDGQGLAPAAEAVSNTLAQFRSDLPADVLRGGGEHRRVAELLLVRKAELEATNNTGCTPLLVAAQYTNREVAEVLIAHKADLNARSIEGFTPLAVAAWKGDETMTVMLLNAGADSGLPDNSGFTPLHTAVEHGHRRVVEALLAHGADPNLARPDGQAPLHTAAGHGDIELLRLLLDKGAFLHALSGSGTPLSWAVLRGRNEAAKFLLDRGTGPNVAAQQSAMTPLHWAAFLGHPDLVRLLLEHGALVNAMSSSMSTPLNAAAGGRWAAKKLVEQNATSIPSAFRQVRLDVGSDEDYAAVIGLLLAAKADVNAREMAYQGTPLFIAVRAGNLPAVEALLVAGADVSARNSIGETPLHSVSKSEAAATVVSNIVVRLLKAGASPDARDDRQATPLHAAAHSGRPEGAALLIAAGARVNLAGPNLLTPLHLAVLSGNRQFVELLLSKGADPERRSKEGATALHAALLIKSKDLVKLLLQHDAVVDAAGPGGATALMGAATMGDTNLMKLLLDAGAKVNAANNERRWTPLHSAAASGQVETARLLLEHNAALEAGDAHGTTPLIRAVKEGRLEMVKFLLERGAQINAADEVGFTALHEAADRGQPEVAEVLLAHHAAVNAHGNSGSFESTPLHCAAQAEFTNQVRYAAVARILLAHGADVNAQMRRNQTPLHRAAEQGHLPVLEVLIAAGADPGARDTEGKTALDLAIAAKREECVEFLRHAVLQSKPTKQP